jgi:O-antigen ligase
MRSNGVGLLVFLFSAMPLAFPGGYQVTAWILVALGIIAILREIDFLRSFKRKLIFVPMFWGYIFYASVCLLIFYVHGEPGKTFGAILPFVFFPLIAIVLLRSRLDTRMIWYGASTGAIIALFIAIYQVYIIGIYRAEGFNGPIRFGNTAVVLGACALVGFVYLLKQNANRKILAFLLFGGLSGLGASLLSGSKGGWLSLVTVLALTFFSATKSWTSLRRILWAGCFLTASTTLILLTPKLPVIDRINSAATGVIVWLETGKVTEGSASIRLESNLMALQMGLLSPWVGIPVAKKYDQMDLVVNKRLVDKVVLDYRAIDNDLLETFVSKGLIGIISILIVHATTFVTFFRYRHTSNQQIKALSTMGMLLPVLYFEFGLASAVFSTTIFRVVYVSWAMVLLGLIFSEQEKQDK